MPRLLQVALCEDTPLDAALLERFIRQSGIACDCFVFDNAPDFLSSFVRGKYDVVFMDIYLGDALGVDAARRARELDEDVLIAFATTSPDYALEGYRLGALKYIEKPVTLKSVSEALSLALLKRKPAMTHFDAFAGEGLNIDDVIYFEQAKHTVKAHTAGGAALCAGMPVKLSDIEKRGLPDVFLRTSHSYIANLRYVWAIDTELSVFKMKNGVNVHISREGLKKAKDAYERFLFSKARGEQNERDEN